MDTTHECPYPGCARRVPRSMLACRAHWFGLPRLIRERVNHAWRHDRADHPEAIREAYEWMRYQAEDRA